MSILALLSDHRGATQVTPFVRSPAPAEAASAHSPQHTQCRPESASSLSLFWPLSPFAFRARIENNERSKLSSSSARVYRPPPSDGCRSLFSRVPSPFRSRDEGQQAWNRYIYIYMYMDIFDEKEGEFFFPPLVACRCRVNGVVWIRLE